MNVFSLGPLYRILNLIKSIFGYIFRIVFWKKKKLDKDDGRIDNDKPIEIISIDQSGNRSSSLLEEQRGEMNMPGNNTLVDWNDWKDSNSQDVPEETAVEEANFFQDMEPTLTRPRVLKIMKNDPVDQHAKHQSRLQAADNTSFEVQSELGTWIESSPGWDEEVLDDLSEEAANILKEKRRLERQKRTVEQKKKKEQQRAIRAERKPGAQLGVKLN